MAYRAKLAECRGDQWVRANMIMDRITSLLGHRYGPMNGKIEPRACGYCNYYGHTRQWCKARIANDEARDEREMDRMIKEDERLFAAIRKKRRVVESYEATKTDQALTFDKLGMPYTIDSHCGPIVGAPKDRHYGKWTFDGDGSVILSDSSIS